MIATQSVPVDKTARGQAITRRRVTLGIRSINEFAAVTQVSRGAITAAEDGRGSENTYVRLETWLDRREEESGFEPGEVLRTAEARDAPADRPPLIQFDVQGPTETQAWKVTTKYTPGFGDEAVADLRKLIHGLMEELGEAPAQD